MSATAGRIWWAEDDPDDRRLIEYAMEQVSPGTAVDFFSSGEEMVRRARAASERIDLFVLDVRMPDLDGFEVFQRLRDRPDSAAVPTVFFSASAPPAEIERAMRLGAKGYVQKPVDFTELKQAVAEVVSRRTLPARRGGDSA